MLNVMQSSAHDEQKIQLNDFHSGYIEFHSNFTICITDHVINA